MMNKLLFLPITIYLLLFTSCSEKNKPLTLNEKIKKAEAKIDINKPLDKPNLLLLIDLYKKMADSLPKDVKAPVYLLKTSDFYGTLKMQNEKCNLYKVILTKYPDFKDADMVMYLLASALDSDLNDRVDAKTYYQMYIEKYPTSIYINDAKSRLITIDSLSFKELEEMIIHQQLEETK